MPDHKVLGQKLKKDYGRVRNALANLSESDIATFMQTQQLSLDGIVLTNQDLQVMRYSDGVGDKYETTFDKEAVVILDVSLDEQLVLEGLAREIINRVQRLRKKVLPPLFLSFSYLLIIRRGCKPRMKWSIITQSRGMLVKSWARRFQRKRRFWKGI